MGWTQFLPRRNLKCTELIEMVLVRSTLTFSSYFRAFGRVCACPAGRRNCILPPFNLYTCGRNSGDSHDANGQLNYNGQTIEASTITDNLESVKLRTSTLNVPSTFCRPLSLKDCRLDPEIMRHSSPRRSLVTTQTTQARLHGSHGVHLKAVWCYLTLYDI